MARHGKRSRNSGIGAVSFKSNAGYHGGVGIDGGRLAGGRKGKRGKRK